MPFMLRVVYSRAAALQPCLRLLPGLGHRHTGDLSSAILVRRSGGAVDRVEEFLDVGMDWTAQETLTANGRDQVRFLRSPGGCRHQCA
jgi:hypothetical protein